MTNSEYRKSPEFMKEISFKELVKQIDEKWGHTYEPFKLDAEYKEHPGTLED